MKLRYFAKYVNLPFLLEHFYFFYFPEQVGRKDEIVQRLVIRGDYLLFCSLPFLHAFLNKDDIITNMKPSTMQATATAISIKFSFPKAKSLLAIFLNSLLFVH